MSNGGQNDPEITKGKFSDERLEQIVRDRIYWERGIIERISVNDAKLERLDDELREVRQQLVAAQKENADSLRTVAGSISELSKNFERFMARLEFVSEEHDDFLKGNGAHNRPGLDDRLRKVEQDMAVNAGKMAGAAGLGGLFGAIAAYIAPHLTGWK